MNAKFLRGFSSRPHNLRVSSQWRGSCSWNVRWLLFGALAFLLCLNTPAAAQCLPFFQIGFGSQGSGPGQFSLPEGVTVGATGNILVADTLNHRIEVFSTERFLLFAFGSQGNGEGQFQNPRGVAVDAVGRIYVVDTGNHRIEVFSSTGMFLFAFGSFGAGDGQFNRPSGIAIDAAGRIYVVEEGNNRVQVFDRNGMFLFKFGGSGNDPGQFNGPQGLTVDANGKIYVADALNHRIEVFSSTGAFLFAFGSFGTGDGQFNNPISIAVGPDGTIYVVDLVNQRVEAFNNNGTFLLKFGSQGGGEGQFNRPSSLALSPDGRVYVADRGNSRIEIFGCTSTCDLKVCFTDASTWCNALTVYPYRYKNFTVIIPNVNFCLPIPVYQFTAPPPLPPDGCGDCGDCGDCEAIRSFSLVEEISPFASQDVDVRVKIALGCGFYYRNETTSSLVAAFVATQLNLQDQVPLWFIQLNRQRLFCHVVTPANSARALPVMLSAGPVPLLTDNSTIEDLFVATKWAVLSGTLNDQQKVLAVYQQLRNCQGN